MGELVFDLTGYKPEIDGYRHSPELLEGIVGLNEFRAVVQKDSSVVPFFYTQAFQGAGQGVDPFIEPLPGDICVPAGNGDSLWVESGHAGKELAEAFPGNGFRLRPCHDAP